MALDPKTKKAQDQFAAARKDLPAKVPDAVKKDYAALTAEADTWLTQMKNYGDAVGRALDHTKYDQKKKELDAAKDQINQAVDQAKQIKANYLSQPATLQKLAAKVAEKSGGDLTVKLTKLVAGASAITGLETPDTMP